MPNPKLQYYADGTPSVLKKRTDYTKLRFYQRSDVLYQLTKAFFCYDVRRLFFQLMLVKLQVSLPTSLPVLPTQS
jgi:hypothetical protein